MKILRPMLLLVCFFPQAGHAHVGSKDVFQTVSLGSYKLYVTVRMPTVIPGVANVEVRSTGSAITSIEITPLPVTGEAATHPPTPDPMRASQFDGAFFTGGVWMMSAGSWQVRLHVKGADGEATTSIPVPAVPIATLRMQRQLGIPLALLGGFLLISMAGVIGAAVREARLPAGASVTPSLRRRGLLATAGGLIVMGLIVWAGAKWWNVEAASYAAGVYRPLVAQAGLSGNNLDLDVKFAHVDRQAPDSGTSALIPDHGRMIHLYAIRMPEMDAVFHLHPEYDPPRHFRMSLPAMPQGEYALYGDIVHANGFPETLTSKVEIPAGMSGAPLGADDASALPMPLDEGNLENSFRLPDGYTMLWDKPALLTASTAYSFRFRLLSPNGSPAQNMQPYLGMAGHAAFVKTDGTVFAHTHPEGSAPMPAMMLVNAQGGDMAMSPEPITNAVEFPYGFPSAGSYRIFVQIKHDSIVETGVFDASVK